MHMSLLSMPRLPAYFSILQIDRKNVVCSVHFRCHRNADLLLNLFETGMGLCFSI